ncbi:lysM and putative peptidoglycan-binding domain-containing protein 3 [Centruroides vittatus]|uniref:lysM and putative peptidoglycan-binding domain-containing protein 3 n=1 Tax=Centruroides vittatus TaxID=120091 RepID=UPI00350EF227
MSSDFFRHVGKRRKDKRKKYNYTRLETDDDEIHGRDTTEDEILSSQVYPLKERKSPPSKSVHYLEHQIREGDSLQKLSLLYRCPVAELKRANRLLSNQEFYGLKKIKIPVKSYSILTEILPSAGCSNGTVDAEQEGESVRTFHLGIGRVLNGEERSEAAAFLKKMDEDLTKIRESTKLYKDSLEEAAVTLTAPQFRPLVDGGSAKYNGADCGLQWKTLIVAIVVFALILPIIVILYIQLHKSLVPQVNNSTEIHSQNGG